MGGDATIPEEMRLERLWRGDSRLPKGEAAGVSPSLSACELAFLPSVPPSLSPDVRASHETVLRGSAPGWVVPPSEGRIDLRSRRSVVHERMMRYLDLESLLNDKSRRDADRGALARPSGKRVRRAGINNDE